MIGTWIEVEEPRPLQENSNGRVMSTTIRSPLRTMRWPAAVTWRPVPPPCTATATASVEAPRAARASRDIEMPVLAAVKTRARPNDHNAIWPRTPSVVSSSIRVEPEASSMAVRNASSRSAGGSGAVSNSTAIANPPVRRLEHRR